MQAARLRIKLKRYTPPIAVDRPAWSRWRHQMRRLDRLSLQEITALVGMLRSGVRRAESAAAYRRRRAWHDWPRGLTEDDHGRRACRWIKETAPWTLASTHESHGVCSAQEEAERQAKPWHQLRQSGDGLPPFQPPAAELTTALPTEEELRTSAITPLRSARHSAEMPSTQCTSPGSPQQGLPPLSSCGDTCPDSATCRPPSPCSSSSNYPSLTAVKSQ